ncbi:MAG TPA: hemolysin family protein [Dehalococcoidales bacterium]|nr:hemolysin family protein [Dehalococcoidales bacterium]
MSDTGIYILIFIACVLLSAYFSASEIAFMSLQRYKLEALAQKKVRGVKLVTWLKDHPERFLSTVLLGNNLVNIAAASVGTALAVGLLGSKTGIIVSTVIVTIIILIFGDAIPKTTASRHSEKISFAVAPTIKFFSWILMPFVVVLSWITSAFGRVFGARQRGSFLVSEEEIRAMINAGSRDGTVEQTQAQMLHNVFELGDRPAREILVPRTEVVWIEKGTTFKHFFEIYNEHPYYRYPVFEDRRDNVVGVLSSKDVLLKMAHDSCDMESTIDSIIRPAYFVPESKPINELLHEMRENNHHMTIVVDEYGGTSGIITLTQLVEEIIGEVKDELSLLEKEFEIIDESTFLVAGGMRIEDINNEMKLGIPEGDYETVAGFVLKIMSKIPKIGEQYRYRDLKLVITQMNGKKIEEIKIVKEIHAAPSNKV